MRRSNKPIDNRILLYQERSASECMNAAIDFMRQNWRLLLRYSLYIMLPVCVLQSVGLVSIVDTAFAQVSDFPVADFVTLFIFGGIGFILLNALLWTLMRIYHDSPDGLASLTGKEFRRRFWPMVGRMTVAAIVIAIVIVPVWALSTIVLMIVPFAFFVYMLVALPILLIAPIFALERCSIFAAVKRAFSNGFRQFGTLVVMAITLVILVYVMQGLALLPWGLLVALKRLLIQPSAAVSPILAVLGESLFNIFSVLLCYVTYLSMAVVLLSGAYLYGSAVQQKEDVSLATDIDNFENL